MTTRKNTFLLKRSNVPGKVPSPGDLQLGELALNTSDAILYTSGTTANSILPIGWDRLSTLSGGTVYGNTIFTNGLTASTLFVEGLTQTSGITSTGGIIFPQKTINSTYTAQTEDYTIDASGGTFTVYLPTAVGIQGKLYNIKNNGGGAITVQPTLNQTIDDKPYVILGETNALQLVSNGFDWVALGYNISTVNSSTGVFEFTGITTLSATTFYVSPVKGWIVDDTTNPLSPQITYLNYSGGSHTAIYVNTATETWVYLNSNGSISQTNIPLTDQERRENIFLGKLGHANKTNIINSFSQPDFVLSPLAQLRDMFDPISLINGGITPSANGTNLSINTSAGYLHGLGINFANNTLNPNSIYVSGTAPCTFQYRTQTGGTALNTTFIDPTKYDVGGVITNLSGTKATNQRIYLVQNGQFRIQYGQTEYANLAQAIAGIATEPFITFSNFTNNGILIGILSVLSTATNLTDTSKAQFFNVSKFGETVGAAGGSSTTNLQQAYNNSVNPEIITNSTLNGLQIRGGTGNDVDKSLILENNAGIETAYIQANGQSNFSGITSTGGIIFPHKTILNTYNVTTSDYFINITGGTLDVNLLSAVGVEGKLLAVKNEGSGIVNVISQSGQTIDDRTNVLLTKGNSVQLVSDGTNWVILGYNISSTQANTGVISFSGLSKITNTTFYVGPVKGFIVDDTTNPVIPFLTYVEYSGGVHTDNYVNTDFETFVYITSGGTIGQQPTPLTEQQRRQNIFLGKLGHPEKISINLVFSQPDYIQSPLSQLRDMFVPINLINGGVVPSTNGVNLKFNTSAGYLYGLGINFTNNTLNPNSLFIPGTNPCTFQYRTQTGGTVTNVTDIDPLNYDVGGIKTPIIGTKASNQRIYLLQNGSIRVQYGQNVYTTLAQAVEELQTEIFVPFPNFINNAVLIGILTVLSTATDLTDTAKARFFFASKFGETVGAAGGISTTNLQQAYNNSSNPEIITNSIQNAVQFRGGTGNDNDKSVVFENNVGSQTAYIRADGKALFNTISATTIGNSGSCVTDLYVSNIHSCSPLIIQPNNEGNVYFGSTSAVTIDLTNNRLGVGITSPTAKFHINNTTSGNTFLAEDDTNPDSSPFVIDTNGNVAIGKTSVTIGTLVDLEVAGKTIGINIGNSNTSFMAGTGIFSYGGGIGIHGIGRSDNGTVVGIKGESVFDISADPSTTYYGGEFISSGQGGRDYAVRLSDGTEGVGKFLYSVDANGSANWTSQLSGTSLIINGDSTITGTTYTKNLIVTGSTQSIFSGNSSVELVRITQVGTGDAFVVEDSANADISHFVINNVGNTAIGLTIPREKLDISGNTIVSGTLSGGTIVITTEPTSGFTTTQILMRNSTSGQVEITDSTSPSIYNYGMSYAMTTFNYLT